MLSPSGFIYSSRRISPGWIAGNSFVFFRAMVLFLVIVDNLHAFRVFSRPYEADAVSIIDADTVLAAPVALKRFQVIAGAHQITQHGGCVDHPQFTTGNFFNRFESADPL